MTLYTLALFLHVSGAIGIFGSLFLWLFGLAALRRASHVEQVRAIAWMLVLASPLMVGSVLLLGVGGFEMALSTWGIGVPWIVVSLVSVLLIGPIGAFVLDPRMRSLLATTREVPDGPLPEALFSRTHDPILMTGAAMLTTLLLGIVFLMTTKPALVLAILVMAVVFVLALVLSLPFWMAGQRQAHQRAASTHDGEADPFLKQTLWTRRW